MKKLGLFLLLAMAGASSYGMGNDNNSSSYEPYDLNYLEKIPFFKEAKDKRYEEWEQSESDRDWQTYVEESAFYKEAANLNRPYHREW